MGRSAETEGMATASQSSAMYCGTEASTCLKKDAIKSLWDMVY